MNYLRNRFNILLKILLGESFQWIQKYNVFQFLILEETFFV